MMDDRTSSVATTDGYGAQFGEKIFNQPVYQKSITRAQRRENENGSSETPK